MIPVESRPTCYAWAVDSTEGSQIRVVDHVLFIYAIFLINSKRYVRKERTQSPSTQTNNSERTYVSCLIPEDAPTAVFKASSSYQRCATKHCYGGGLSSGQQRRFLLLL